MRCPTCGKKVTKASYDPATDITSFYHKSGRESTDPHTVTGDTGGRIVKLTFKRQRS